MNSIQRIEKYDENNNCSIFIVIDNLMYKENKNKGQVVVGPPMNEEFRNIKEPNYEYEIFICNIPKYFREMNLIQIVSKIGAIYSMKMFYTFSDQNRGYAFVKFVNVETALTALHQLQGYRIGQKSRLRVTRSINNNIVFLGNLNANRYSLLYVEARIKAIAKHVRRVCVYAASEWARYSVTVEFFDHSDAAIFRRAMISLKDTYFTHSVILNWYGNAVPQTQMIADKSWTSRNNQTNPITNIMDMEEFCKLNSEMLEIDNLALNFSIFKQF